MTKQEIRELRYAWNELISSNFYDPLGSGNSSYRKITQKNYETLSPFFDMESKTKLKVGEVEISVGNYVNVETVWEKRSDGTVEACYVIVNDESLIALYRFINYLVYLYDIHRSPKRERLLKKEEKQ